MRRIVLLAAFALPLAAGPALSQGDAAPPRLQSQVDALNRLISLEFPGGTLSGYLAAIEEAAAGEPLNIMVTGPADEVAVGPVELHDVAVEAAIDVVSNTTYSEGGATFLVRSDTRFVGAGRPVHRVVVERRGSMSRATDDMDSGPREVLVLQIKPLTTPLPGDPPETAVPAETVLTAVETAIAVSIGDGDRTELKYHAASGLLMLSGPDMALIAAREVVRQIEQETEHRRDRARDLQQMRGLADPEDLEEQLADARAELEMLQVRARVEAQRLGLYEQEMEKLEQGYAAGAVGESEVHGAKFDMAEARALVEEQAIAVERQEQRVGQLERALERARAIAAGGGVETEAAALREENAMLRDRLAVLEAQLRALQERLASQGGGAGGGR